MGWRGRVFGVYLRWIEGFHPDERPVVRAAVVSVALVAVTATGQAHWDWLDAYRERRHAASAQQLHRPEGIPREQWDAAQRARPLYPNDPTTA